MAAVPASWLVVVPISNSTSLVQAGTGCSVELSQHHTLDVTGAALSQVRYHLRFGATQRSCKQQALVQGHCLGKMTKENCCAPGPCSSFLKLWLCSWASTATTSNSPNQPTWQNDQGCDWGAGRWGTGLVTHYLGIKSLSFCF